MTVVEWERVHSGQAWGRWPNTRLVEAFMREHGHLSREERRAVKVLELGCGAGAQLRFLGAEGFDPYGVDGSAAAISAARYVAPESWLNVHNIAHPNFSPPHRMDCIIDVCTLQHLGSTDAMRVIQRCRREWLKPGGLLISIHAAEHTTVQQPDHIPAPRLLAHADIPVFYLGFERTVSCEIVITTPPAELRHWIIEGRL